jgi:hypothetical protein
MYFGAIFHPIFIPRGTLMSVESSDAKYIAELRWKLIGIATYEFYLYVYNKESPSINAERYLFCDDVIPNLKDIQMQWENNSLTIKHDRIHSLLSRSEISYKTATFYLNEK